MAEIIFIQAEFSGHFLQVKIGQVLFNITDDTHNMAAWGAGRKMDVCGLVCVSYGDRQDFNDGPECSHQVACRFFAYFFEKFKKKAVHFSVVRVIQINAGKSGIGPDKRLQEILLFKYAE